MVVRLGIAKGWRNGVASGDICRQTGTVERRHMFALLFAAFDRSLDHVVKSVQATTSIVNAGARTLSPTVSLT